MNNCPCLNNKQWENQLRVVKDKTILWKDDSCSTNDIWNDPKIEIKKSCCLSSSIHLGSYVMNAYTAGDFNSDLSKPTTSTLPKYYCSLSLLANGNVAFQGFNASTAIHSDFFICQNGIYEVRCDGTLRISTSGLTFVSQESIIRITLHLKGSGDSIYGNMFLERFSKSEFLSSPPYFLSLADPNFCPSTIFSSTTPTTEKCWIEGKSVPLFKPNCSSFPPCF